MDPIVKKILNSLRCPICKGQIDLVEAKKGNNFGCVREPHHYSFFFVHWEQPYRIEHEDVAVYYGKHLYEIRQYHYTSTGGTHPQTCTDTVIYIKEVDKEFRVIEKAKVERFEYNKTLFDFQQTDKDKIINRVRTILVFQ